MDYQNARSIRKKSLLSLIAEKKFEEGQGLGSSIGGAISDKFKAKAMGFKEALDPLNFVRKITGQGAIGDIAVTGLGRLFGRKDRDIQAFGGYGRKKVRNKKDPNFTTIGPGPVRRLRVKDSTADILGKMYNFMLKKSEIDTRAAEIQKSFRQEQLDEDDRRHKELVKAIKAFTSGGATTTPEKKESIFDKILKLIADFKDSIMKLIDPILNFFKGTLGKVFNILSKAGPWLLDFLSAPGLATAALILAPAIIAAMGSLKLMNQSTEAAKEGNIEKLKQSARMELSTAGNGQVNEDDVNTIVEGYLKIQADKGEPGAQKAYEDFKKDKNSVGTGDNSFDGLTMQYLKQKYNVTVGNKATPQQMAEAKKYAKQNAGKPASQITPIDTSTATKPTSSASAVSPSAVSTSTSGTSATPSSKTPQKSKTQVSTATPTTTVAPVMKQIPPKVSADTSSTSGESKVNVNNSVNNIGGKPAKEQNLNIAKPRNSALMDYLTAIAIPV
jgi:hypothetical protein